MAQLPQPPRPVLRTAAGLHANHARRPIREMLEELRPAQPLVHHLPGCRVDPVQLEHPLRCIHADDRSDSLHPGPSRFARKDRCVFPLGTLMPSARGGPPQPPPTVTRGEASIPFSTNMLCPTPLYSRRRCRRPNTTCSSRCETQPTESARSGGRLADVRFRRGRSPDSHHAKCLYHHTVTRGRVRSLRERRAHAETRDARAHRPSRRSGGIGSRGPWFRDPGISGTVGGRGGPGRRVVPVGAGVRIGNVIDGAGWSLYEGRSGRSRSGAPA